MDIHKFEKEIPNLEGYTISGIRLSKDEVLGFVLKNKKGEKCYILYFGDDLRVEDYW